MLLHAAALGAAFATLTGVALGFTVLGIGLSCAYLVADVSGLLATSVQSLQVREDGSGTWSDRAGRQYSVQSTRASWVSSAFMVIGLRATTGRTRWLVLMPDSAAPDSLRKLRVWLKWRPV